MANEFKIKSGLLLGPSPTQPVTSITDSSVFTNDSSTLASVNAIKGYVDTTVNTIDSSIVTYVDSEISSKVDAVDSSLVTYVNEYNVKQDTSILLRALTSDVNAYNIIQDTSSYKVTNRLDASIARIDAYQLIQDASIAAFEANDVTFAYVDGSISTAVNAVDSSLVTYVNAYNIKQDTSILLRALTTTVDAYNIKQDTSILLRALTSDVNAYNIIQDTSSYKVTNRLDASIARIDSYNIIQDTSLNKTRLQLDASVVRLDAYNKIQDTSMLLRALTSDVNAYNIIQDTSSYKVTNRVDASIARIDASLWQQTIPTDFYSQTYVDGSLALKYNKIGGLISGDVSIATDLYVDGSIFFDSLNSGIFKTGSGLSIEVGDVTYPARIDIDSGVSSGAFFYGTNPTFSTWSLNWGRSVFMRINSGGGTPEIGITGAITTLIVPSLDLFNNKIINLGNPTDASDAVNRLYVDTSIAAISSISQDYIDGSIATAVNAVDSSLVTYINAYNIKQDTSILLRALTSDVNAYNIKQDTSILLRALTTDVNAYNIIQDTSLYETKNQLDASIARIDASLGDYVQKTGDTMTGDLTLTDASLIVGGNIAQSVIDIRIDASKYIYLEPTLYNVALGANALNNLATGQLNVAIGKNALENLDDADGNVAIGVDAGYRVDGHQNTFIGYRSASTTSSSTTRSTFIGAWAGQGITSGTDALIIGYTVTHPGEANNVFKLGSGNNIILDGNMGVSAPYAGAPLGFQTNTIAEYQSSGAGVTISSQLYLSGIGSSSQSNVLYYNSGTGAVTYSASPAGDVTKVYVDGSLATRDAYNIIQDTSILLRALTSDVNAYNIIQDTSSYEVTNRVDASIDRLDENKLNNTTDTFTGILTVDGSILLLGDLYQDGSTYIVNVNVLDVSNNFITLRKGAVTGIADGSVSGLFIEKADGVHNVILGATNDGIMRVGWDSSSLLALAAREDSPTDTYYAYWDDSSSMFKTNDLKGYIDASLNDKISYGADASSLTNILEENVIISEVGTSTFHSLEDYIDLTGSSGKLIGGAFTDLGDGSLHVAAGQGLIRATNDASAELLFFDWAEATINDLVDNTTNYIHVDYNSGTPIIDSETTKSSNNRNIIALGKVFKEGTTINTFNAGMFLNEATKNILARFTQVDGEITRASGGVVSEAGGNSFNVTSAAVWGGITRFVTSAYDYTTDDFEYYYYDGAAWVESDVSTLDSANYNDTTSGLVAITPQQYGVHWIYVTADGEVLVLYGQDSYKLANAQAAQPPSDLPNHVAQFSWLAAKVIILKNATSFTEIESAYDTVFTPSAAGVHNDLSGLQGGTANEYYHLTSADYTDRVSKTYVDGSLNVRPLTTTVNAYNIIQDTSLYKTRLQLDASIVRLDAYNKIQDTSVLLRALTSDVNAYNIIQDTSLYKTKNQLDASIVRIDASLWNQPSGVSTLGALGDVSIGNEVNNQVLTFDSDGSVYMNKTMIDASFYEVIDAATLFLPLLKASDASLATEITFNTTVGTVYGSPTELTGDITISDTDALLGCVNLIIHKDSSLSFPAGTKLLGGTYVADVSNFIYMQYLAPSSYVYTINQIQ